MRKKVVRLQRLSICPCGFPLLKVEIGLGTEYEIDLDSLEEGYGLRCGGCGVTHYRLKTVLASHVIDPTRAPARLPYSVFVGSELTNPEQPR